MTSNDTDEGVIDIPVSFTVDPGAPEIAWSPTNLSKMAEEGDTDILTATLTVTNEGTITLVWGIEVTPTATSWLDCVCDVRSEYTGCAGKPRSL